MVPKKELQALADALKASSEYTDTARMRRYLMQSPMGRAMQGFERAQTRIAASGLPEHEAAARFKKLYADYGPLLAQPAMKEYLRAAQRCNETVSESIAYLNELLETGGSVSHR